MKTYCVKITREAKEDLRRYRDYLRDVKHSSQAAKSVVNDFHTTAAQLRTVAGSLRNPESEVLLSRRLKRINFLKHEYFLLFRIDGDTVYVTNMFHSLEDYENKLQ